MKKFSIAEQVVGFLFTFGIDVFSAALDFVPMIGWIIATGMQSATSFGTTWWLHSKGGQRATKLERQLIKQVSNALPWVPTCTLAFIIEVVLHNMEVTI